MMMPQSTFIFIFLYIFYFTGSFDETHSMYIVNTVLDVSLLCSSKVRKFQLVFTYVFACV